MNTFQGDQSQGFTPPTHQDWNSGYNAPAFVDTKMNAHTYTLYEETKPYSPHPVDDSANLMHPGYPPVFQNVPQGRGWTQLQIQDPDYSNRSRRSRKRPRIFGWILEALGLVVAVAALAVQAHLLQIVDGQRLSSWTHPISINTVVSILSTVMETALAFIVGSSIGQSKWVFFKRRSNPLKRFVAFDEASRGPMGSLTLIWALRSWHWASLGAWVTLALLIVHPFSQAVIVYQGQLDSAPGSNATIARATSLDVGSWSSQITEDYVYRGIHKLMDTYQVYPDAGVSATTLIGFLNSSTTTPTQQPLFSCPSGNCTWPMFSTVGICSRCVDVSQHITVEHKQGFPDENPFVALTGSDSEFVANYTNYVLPYTAGRRLIVQFVDGLANETARYIVAARVPRIDLVPVYRPNETYSFQDSEALLASFGILSAEQAYWDNQTKWQDAKITATECALEYCGLMYQSACSNGRVQETLVTSDFGRVASSFQPTNALAQTVMDGINEDFGQSLGYFGQIAYGNSSDAEIIDRGDLQLSLLSSDNVPDSVQKTFNITQKAITTISSFLNDESTLKGITYSLSDSTNFTWSFATAARMLSNRFREIDSTIEGSNEQWEIYTHVAWVYFFVPSAILALGIIFTLGAVFQSIRQDLDNMKSDPMAMLLHGVDGETRERLRAEKMAGHEPAMVVVKLEDEQNGLNLRSRG